MRISDWSSYVCSSDLVTRSTSAQPIPGRSPILPHWKRISALSCPPAQTSIWSIIAKRQSLSSGGEIKYTAARDFGASRHFGAKLLPSLLNVHTPTLPRGPAPAYRHARPSGGPCRLPYFYAR